MSLWEVLGGKCGASSRVRLFWSRLLSRQGFGNCTNKTRSFARP